jgi:hypothetical protein
MQHKLVRMSDLSVLLAFKHSHRLIFSNGKVDPRTGHEEPKGEKRYRSTLSLTSALDGVGGQHHAPVALPPQEAGWAPGPV